MKTLVNLSLAFVPLLLCSCLRQEQVPSSQQAPLKVAGEQAVAAAAETWETVLDGSSFNSYSAFEAAWNYLYPWGSDHNGTARMYGSSSDHNHIYLENGVLTEKAVRITWNEGNSSSDPYLPIRYHSGAVNTKTHILVNDQFPN